MSELTEMKSRTRSAHNGVFETCPWSRRINWSQSSKVECRRTHTLNYPLKIFFYFALELFMAENSAFFFEWTLWFMGDSCWRLIKIALNLFEFHFFVHSLGHKFHTTHNTTCKHYARKLGQSRKSEKNRQNCWKYFYSIFGALVCHLHRGPSCNDNYTHISALAELFLGFMIIACCTVDVHCIV